MKEYYCIQCDKSYPDDQACRHRYSNMVDPKDIKVRIHCRDCFYGKRFTNDNMVWVECRRYPAIAVDQFGWGIYPRNAENHWCGEGTKE